MVVRACARVSELKVLFGFWETLNFIIIGYFFKSVYFYIFTLNFLRHHISDLVIYKTKKK